jgi:hypothetical protein
VTLSSVVELMFSQTAAYDFLTHVINPANTPSLVPPEQRASYSAIIDDILSKADLDTVSAKAIRKGLQEKVDYDLAPQKVRNIT